MTVGPALKKENIAGYNCSYVAVDRVASFDEILYVLMNGTGVGFSVERQFVSKLPRRCRRVLSNQIQLYKLQIVNSRLGNISKN